MKQLVATGDYRLRYSNSRRLPQGLGQRIEIAAQRQTRSDASKGIAMLVLGGLHHDTRRRRDGDG
jgi:hypothetical protein